MALLGAFLRLADMAAAVTFALALALTINPHWLRSLIAALRIPEDAPTPVPRSSGSSAYRVARVDSEVPCDPDSFWPRAADPSGNTSWRDPRILMNGTLLKTQWLVADQHDMDGYPYPISAEQFRLSFTPPHIESQCRWARIAAALDSGAPVRIGVVGGSMTLGHDSARPWSSFIADWLARAGARRGGWRVSVVNLAIGGRSARQLGLEACPSWEGFDAYIVDTGVNAEWELGAPQMREGVSVLFSCLLRKQAKTAALPAPLPPALMYAEAFDIDLRVHPEFSFAPDCSTVPARHERPAWTNCPQNWFKSAVEGSVARDLGLPVASYRSALWVNYANPPDDTLLFWGQHAHPNVMTHELYSDVIKFALLQLLPRAHNVTSQTCADVPQSNYSVSTFARFIYGTSTVVILPTCAARRSDAGLPAETTRIPTPSAIVGDWQFIADKPGRSVGWVGRYPDADWGAVPPNLSISFPIVLSALPRFEVTVLRSYEHFMDAQVSLSGCTGPLDAVHEWAPISLPGSWKDHYSLPDTTAWDILKSHERERGGGFDVRQLVCAPPAGVNQTLTISALPPESAIAARGKKVKILGVTSC